MFVSFDIRKLESIDFLPWILGYTAVLQILFEAMPSEHLMLSLKISS